MRPRSIGSPSLGCAAGSGPVRASTEGSTLFRPGERCHPMKIAAGRSAGSVVTSRCSASMPPAEAPTTTMSLVAMNDGEQLMFLGRLPHDHDRALALLGGRAERRA